MTQVPYARFGAGTLTGHTASLDYRPDPNEKAGVSCLMVTRGNMVLVEQAYRCFDAQHWPLKELVIICASAAPGLQALAAADTRVKLVLVEPGLLPLGDLRNMAVSHATHPYVCLWDDDDLYHPDRIGIGMAVLRQSRCVAVFLHRLKMWWPARNRLAISERRVWEGSMIAIRSMMPVYPATQRGEDSHMAASLMRQCPFAVMDRPHLYCYRVTGENTWHTAHFEGLFQRATHHCSDAERKAFFDQPGFALTRQPDPAAASPDQ